MTPDQQSTPWTSEVERVRWLIEHHSTPIETHHNAKPDPDRCDFCALARQLVTPEWIA